MSDEEEEEKLFQLKCGRCGSDNVHSNETVEATAMVNGWTHGENGEFVPDYAGESEVWWDTQEVYEDKPYICHDCGTGLTKSEVTVVEDEADDDEEE